MSYRDSQDNKAGKIDKNDDQTHLSTHDAVDERETTINGDDHLVQRLEAHEARYNQNADEAARATDQLMQDQETARHFKRAIRKLDWAIAPILALLWLANFVDRSNAGNARIAGLETDLSLKGNEFNVALAVFYASYIVVEIPSNVVLKKVGGNIWLPAITAAWGFVTAMTALTNNYAGFLAVRIMLGVCEGGLLGGISLYLSMIYPRFMIQQRIARFYAAAAIAGSFGGLLASGLTRLHTGGIAGWRWLYIVEGIITFGFAAIAIFVLPHSVARTRYLNEEERQACLAALAADSSTSRHAVSAQQGVVEKSQSERSSSEQRTEDGLKSSAALSSEDAFEWREVRRGVFDIQTWLTGVGYLCVCCSLYSITLFLPTILQGVFADADQTRIQLLTVPPFVPAAVLVLVVAYIADKVKMRGPFIIGFLPISIVGYAILLGTRDNRARYAAVFLICAGIYPAIPAILTLIANNSAGHYKRATSTAFQLCIANLAGFIATFIYDKAKFGGDKAYIVPHGIVLGCLCLGWICFALNVLYCYLENAARAAGRRDGNIAAYETMVREGKTRAPIGDRHPDFRFSL